MIGSLRKRASCNSNAWIICNIDLQKDRLSAFLRDLSHRFLTVLPITRTDEDLKSLSRELTRYLVANPFICSRNQCRLQVWRCNIALTVEAVVILAWQQLPQHWVWIRWQFLHVTQFFRDNAGPNIDILHLA